MCIYGSIFAETNPAIPDTIPNITILFAALQAAESLPTGILSEECEAWIRFVREVIAHDKAFEQENGRLSQELAAAGKLSLEKDRMIHNSDERIATLEGVVEGMQEKVEEGIRKGWQLEELKRMLFGKKSERYTAYSSDITVQSSLGATFDGEDIEAVITVSRARTAAQKELTAQQQSVPKTNRHQKRHLARKGKRTRINSLEQVVTVMDYPGDKTGLKPMSKQVVMIYDYVPGKIVRSETHFLKYIDKEEHIYKSLVLPRIIERGTVSNRLVAQLHTEKFVYYAPTTGRYRS